MDHDEKKGDLEATKKGLRLARAALEHMHAEDRARPAFGKTSLEGAAIEGLTNALEQILGMIEALPRSIEAHVCELRAPDMEYTATPLPSKGGQLKQPEGAGWRPSSALTEQMLAFLTAGAAAPPMLIWEREKPAPELDIRAIAENFMAMVGWPSSDRGAAYLEDFGRHVLGLGPLRVGSAMTDEDIAAEATPEERAAAQAIAGGAHVDMEERVADLVRRWLDGPRGAPIATWRANIEREVLKLKGSSDRRVAPILNYIEADLPSR